ncbi:MAG: prolyl oligopeptidase family serine peptidase [Acidobacteria bacterium]|nr:prolyl oligopeptidase family serine peptidase [Acidobacteriota bacterium]
MRSHFRQISKFSVMAFAVVLLAFGSMAYAQGAKTPPLLDRELFFGNPEISGAQISPDGQFIAFIKPYKDTRNVWVKKTAEPFSAARPLTDDTKRPIQGYFWSRDGRFILYVQDNAGDENFNLYAVNPAEKPAAGRDVPAARNLTDLKKVRVEILAVPKSDPDLMFIGLNDRDPAWHDVYKLKISTGEKALIRKNTDRISGWVFDLKDQLRLATRTADNGDTEILTVGADGFKKIYSCTIFESCGPVRFNKDNKRVYMVTNKGDQNDLLSLSLLDPETGKEELVESDPLKKVDFGSPLFSDLTDELIGTVYEDDRSRYYWRDKKYEEDVNAVKKQLGSKEIGLGASTKDEMLWILSSYSDTEPGETYLYDRKTKKLTLQYRVREKLQREFMTEMKPVSYKSSDGLEIPAYLTLPKGVEAKNLPAVIIPHGGPWARDSWGFDNFAQFLANRGYAVLQPNFRGSTGFGKKFLNAGNKQWGDRMQDDITWGVKYLVSQGIADPKRVGIMGGSYGGYATLAGVAFTPDVYAAGVSIVGPSNLITLLESIPPYWEAGRKVFHERMGDPTNPQGKAQLERQSPLNSASKIRTPLLVVQGANDPRVNKAESDQIVVALRERGFPVEYIVAPDEGHGFARPVNNMAMFAAAEKFLAKHLGGRFQEGGTPESVQRLKEITVDVKTVELPKRAVAVAGSPKPAVELRTGISNYDAKIELGGQTLQFETMTDIKEENGAWSVNETAKMPNGEVSDKVVLEKGTLILTRRMIKQGPVTIDLSFKDNKATGTMAMGGEPKPVSAETGGALFADGAGTYDVLAALPLADGYSVVFRNYDIQKQKSTLKQIKVTGAEKVTVPAGTFDAFKCEVTSAEGEPGLTTVWISKDGRRVVKITAVLPQLNGATMVSVLK